MFDYCAMNIWIRSMLWTMWLLTMRQIVYVACEDVKLCYSIQSDGIWWVKVAAILKKTPVAGILYLSYMASLTLKT